MGDIGPIKKEREYEPLEPEPNYFPPKFPEPEPIKVPVPVEEPVPA